MITEGWSLVVVDTEPMRNIDVEPGSSQLKQQKHHNGQNRTAIRHLSNNLLKICSSHPI